MLRFSTRVSDGGSPVFPLRNHQAAADGEGGGAAEPLHGLQR